MRSLVECVPNFSEGRHSRTIAEIAASISSVATAEVLDIHADADHDRCVVTFVAQSSNVGEAAFRGAETAARNIDLNKHRGQHPRIGAVDVIPFVPIEGVTTEDCVTIARCLGSRLGDELQIPVYLYGAAAPVSTTRTLADIRRGQFEELLRTIAADETRIPDFGPRQVHPTAGATAIGVRPFLIAFNIILDSDDVETARKISKKIRESSGGLCGVQATGFLVRGYAQVSTNITDLSKVTLGEVFNTVRHEGSNMGIRVLKSEIVGLAPRDALANVDTVDLGLPGQITDYVLEERLGPLVGNAN